MSKRMGQDKGQCPLNDTALINYAIEALSGICNPIVISANSENYRNLGYKVIPDVYSGIGPLGGIYSGLLNSETELNFILSCDMPLIGSDSIEYILSHMGNHQAVIPLFNGFSEPLCACYRKDCLDHLVSSIHAEIYKLQDVLKGLDTKFLPFDSALDFYHKELFANVNDKDELRRIEELLKRQQSDEA